MHKKTIYNRNKAAYYNFTIDNERSVATLQQRFVNLPT